MLLGQELNRLILSLPAIKYSHFLEFSLSFRIKLHRLEPGI